MVEKPVEEMTTPDPAVEQRAPANKETSAPSKEGAPRSGKDEKQTTIPDMGDLTRLEIW